MITYKNLKPFLLQKFCFCLLLIISVNQKLHAQNSHTITGTIVSNMSQLPIANASVQVIDSKYGTITDQKGLFQLNLHLPLSDSILIQCSCIGYQTRVIKVSTDAKNLPIELLDTVNLLQDIVVSASRKMQSIFTSPVSIEKLNVADIQKSPALNFYDAIQSLKGVQAVTSGLTYKQINTRGFNNTGNQRFLQLIDGIDNQGPGLNFSVGNLFGVNDLDVASVEVIPGAASALYGPIAFNGLLQMQTKDPFQFPGLTVQIKSGLNHLHDSNIDPQLFQNISLRYAVNQHQKLGFKFNIDYFKGSDWIANNLTDVGVGTPVENRGPNNPGKDQLNIYGDEVNRTLPGIGLVSRTGYAEKDLMNYQSYNLKYDASVYYKFNQTLTLKYQYRVGIGTAAYTGSSRFSLNNYQVNNHSLELKSNAFLWRVYRTTENSGDTYNSRSLAQFINKTWVQDANNITVAPSKATDTWFNQYQAAFNGQVTGVTGGSHDLARAYADRGRFLPGSVPFDQAKDFYIHQYGLAGAGVYTRCGLTHSDIQYDFSGLTNNKLDLIIGGSARLYDMNTNGGLFDDKDKKLTMLETGLFIQSTNSFLNKKLKITSSLRYDKNENFAGNFTPRISAVYHLIGQHYVRSSFQTGFRNPTTVDLFIKLNAGPITILGGAPQNSSGLNVYENSFYAASVSKFSNAVNQLVATGVNLQQAIVQSKDLLQKSAVSYVMPEKLKAFDLGYRGRLNHQFNVDVNLYYSSYSGFILNTVVQRPVNTILSSNGSINAAAAADLLNGNSQNFQLYTNSAETVQSYGYTVGIDWNGQKGWEMGANLSYNQVGKISNQNQIVSFNTPPYRTNFYVGKNNWGNYGCRITWQWQNEFLWYGTFNGNRPGAVPAFSQVDLQVTHHWPSLGLTLKAGGNNILNHYVSQAYGSPAVGGIYYVGLQWGK